MFVDGVVVLNWAYWFIILVGPLEQNYSGAFDWIMKYGLNQFVND